MMGNYCAIVGCWNRAGARGLCADHRSRQSKTNPQRHTAMLEHHCSEECGPADVGVLLHISATDALWIGEITSKEGEAFGIPDHGWHMVHHTAGGKVHVGFVPDNYPAIDLAEALAAAITKPSGEPS